MKKILIPVALIILSLFVSCNSSENKGQDHSGHSSKEPKTQTDSLMADVMDGHDVGMAKMGKLATAQKEVKRLLDSIAQLPRKMQGEAAPLKEKLAALANDLSYAETAMDKWMGEFNMDSAVNNMEQRIKYLTDEKMKVGKVKEAILGSLAKADSLLKTNR